MPLKSDLDLDMLDDLPDLQAEESAKPAEQPADPQPDELAWQAAAPPRLGPSVTQLLREAEATPQQHPADSSVSSSYGAARADTAQFASFTPNTQAAAEPPSANEPAPVAFTYAMPATPPNPPASEPAAIAAPAPISAPVVAPIARARTVGESVIGPDDFFDGRYRSERGVRIQGNARGSIESRQYIYVEAGAQVEADLSAEEITVAGDFTGKITCRGRLEVTSSGKIQGEVETALLVVQEGGAIDGQLNMRKGGEPAAS